MDNKLSRTKILEILREQNVGVASPLAEVDAEIVASRVSGLTEEEFKKVIVGASLVSKEFSFAVKNLSLKDLIKSLEQTDKKFLAAFGELFFNCKARHPELSDEAVASFVFSARRLAGAETSDLSKLAGSAMTKIEQTLSGLNMSAASEIRNSTIAAFDSSEIGNQVYANCVDRIASFLKQNSTTRAGEIVKTLKSGLSEQNTFTDAEILEISGRCGSLFVASSVEKLQLAEKAVEDFKNMIMLKDFGKDTNFLDEQYKQAIQGMSLKKLLVMSPTVGTFNMDDFAFSLRFLTEKPLGEIASEEVSPKYKWLKGKFNLEDVIKLINNSPSCLCVNAEKVQEVASTITETFDEHGVKVSQTGLINADNFPDICALRKMKDRKQNFSAVYEILTEFFTPQALAEVLHKRLDLLNAEPYEVLIGVYENAKKATNTTEFKDGLFADLQTGFEKYRIKQSGEKRKVEIKPYKKGDLVFDKSLEADFGRGSTFADVELFNRVSSQSIGSFFAAYHDFYEGFADFAGFDYRKIADSAERKEYKIAGVKRARASGAENATAREKSKKEKLADKDAELSSLWHRIIATVKVMDYNAHRKNVVLSRTAQIEAWKARMDERYSELQEQEAKCMQENYSGYLLYKEGKKQIEKKASRLLKKLFATNNRFNPPNQLNMFQDFVDVTIEPQTMKFLGAVLGQDLQKYNLQGLHPAVYQKMQDIFADTAEEFSMLEAECYGEYRLFKGAQEGSGEIKAQKEKRDRILKLIEQIKKFDQAKANEELKSLLAEYKQLKDEKQAISVGSGETQDSNEK